MSDWDNYSENLAFDPANSMPRCDIEELKAKVSKLEEKLRIAEEAFKKIINYNCVSEQVDKYRYLTIDIKGIAEQTLDKIKE